MDDLFGSHKELSRSDKMRKSRKVTTTLTTDVIHWLNNSGQFKAWRNNNIPSTRHQVVEEIFHAFDKDGNPIEIKTEHVKVNFKKNQKTVSTFDIIGFRKKDGLHLEIEIKSGKDKLDEDQQSHLNDLQASGSIAFATADIFMFKQQIAKWVDEKPYAF